MSSNISNDITNSNLIDSSVIEKTLDESNVNSFITCSNIESKGEDVFYKNFNDYLEKKNCTLTKHKTKIEQRLGDYTIHNKTTNKKYNIDRKHELETSCNMFLELISNKNKKILGWCFKPIYNIVYSFDNHYIYPFINLQKLVNLIGLNQKTFKIFKDEKGKEYIFSSGMNKMIPLIEQRKYNQDNITQGILIRFKDINKCIDKVIKYENNEMIDCCYSEFLKIAYKPYKS